MSTSTETTTWYGKVCTECRAAFESSPTNCVSVRDFEYCPSCGNATLETRQIEVPLGEFVEDHLQGDS